MGRRALAGWLTLFLTAASQTDEQPGETRDVAKEEEKGARGLGGGGSLCSSKRRPHPPLLRPCSLSSLPLLHDTAVITISKRDALIVPRLCASLAQATVTLRGELGGSVAHARTLHDEPKHHSIFPVQLPGIY